jgi:hypothetical protein
MANCARRMIRSVLYQVVVSTPMFSRYMGWRRSRLKLAYVASRGNVVAFGPFADMRLQVEYSELPKFLGTYEASLHARRYDTKSSL